MGETLQTLGIYWPKLIAQTVNFGIVLFVLWRFAYRPVLAMLEQRRQKVAESITNADKIKEQLAQTEVQRQQTLDEASKQANKIIEEARAAAAQVGEQERQKAIADAQQILAKAHEAGEAQLARMKGELRKEFGRLVVQASMQATGKILSPEDQRRLTEDTNNALAA